MSASWLVLAHALLESTHIVMHLDCMFLWKVCDSNPFRVDATRCHCHIQFDACCYMLLPQCRAELTTLATSERSWMDFNPLRSEPHAVQALQHQWANLRFIRCQIGDASADRCDVSSAACRHHVSIIYAMYINNIYIYICSSRHADRRNLVCLFTVSHVPTEFQV